MSDQFVHLHVHTAGGSILDGLAHVKDLVAEAKRLGQPAVAVTDHGTMHMAVDLYREAKSAGIKPIIGIEAYVAPGGTSRHGRDPVFFGSRSNEDRVEGSNDVSGKGAYTHMILLAQNNEGMRNLFKLSSLSYIEGQYKKPRMDLESIAQFSKGLIGTTGCPSGDIQTRIRLGQFDEAVSYAAQMQDILGKENYFLELMDHDMSKDLERGVREDLLRLAKKLDIPLLATNDLHYTKRSDSISHEHMLAVQTGSVMSERPDFQGGKRFAFEGDNYYVKSRQEMESVFPDLPQALNNSLLIAERCEISFDEDADLRPRIDIPEGYSEAEWLRKEAFEGLSRRLPDKANEPQYIDQLEEELRVITMKDYVGYFLVVSDFVRWAKQNDVGVGAGRGSAAGSLLAFCIDITDADPIRHGLIFERFINPERDSPPDIDMDFDDVNRPRVIDYVIEKYGEDRVAQIATFTKVKAKTAIKDAQKILEEPYALANELTKAFPPPVQGRELPLYAAYDANNERYNEAEPFRTLVKEKGAERIIEVARGLEGVTRGTGMHAAGIIMSNKPLIDVIPLMTRKGSMLITQFDYPTCESLGLLKVDFLGLRNLTIMRYALENIKKRHGIDIDLNELWAGPMDDQKTYDLLSRGETLGVFQLDGAQMRELLKRIIPTTFDDISAVIALYRPGPMGVNAHNDYADRKNNRQPITPIHPEMETVLNQILGETYSLIVYQEQVMQAAQRIAGYSLAAADNLRRAMGKKKRSVLEAEYVNFEKGALESGYSEEAIKTLWNVLVPFADYAFNKSHSVGYGYISYATAYLKANYPADYMAAVLSSVDDPVKVALYLNECRRMGIKVLPPDVSRSEVNYTAINDDTILFGLGAVRGIGPDTAVAIEAGRKGGTYKNLSEFFAAAPPVILNKRVLEGLTDAGGFDSFGYSRRALFAQLPDIGKGMVNVKKKEEAGQSSLFSMFDDDEDDSVGEDFQVNIEPIEEHSKREKLRRERHALGLYVSDHPLSNMENALKGASNAVVAEIITGEVKAQVGFSNDAPKTKIAGIITSVTKKTTKMGDQFAIVNFEDMTGSMEVVFFPKTYANFSSMIAQDEICVITGVVRARETGRFNTNEDGSEEEIVEINMTADSFELLDVDDSGKTPVWFRLGAEQLTDETRLMMNQIFTRNTGEMPVKLSVRQEDGSIQVVDVASSLSVKPGGALVSEMRELFGIGCIGRWR